ncbi:hypothetical protein [Sporosarcina sp. G11-34]|uniref:hypothetical protein n=1 Tax=Sporosarcina sp. G11-34 TaxID=2849605 RepID=UPI0022A9C033|nr:hypothetical protein [Sporosarcina sp. G11-34]MCZ2257258.1 hypothetical protein [Sporosarcina sp. G11-34]
MNVTNFIIIANTTVPATWIALVVAFVVAYFAIRLKFGKRISGVLSDSIFYFIIVWKFSVILTDFQNVIKAPLSIIYFNGGRIGFYLGLLAIIITILIELKRKTLHKFDLVPLFVGVITIQTIYQILMAFLNDGSLVAKIMTVLIFSTFTLLVWGTMKKFEKTPIQLALLFTAVHIFAASFQPVGIFGIPVFTTLIISLFFIIITIKESKIVSEDIL